MNPLAIRLYQMHGHDLTASPLKFTLNNQHLNGGIEVDIWGRTSLTGCYAAGKMPEHMVSRARWSSAQCRASFRPPLCITYCSSEKRDRPLERQQILSTINEAQQYLNQGLLRDDVRETIQNTMSHHAAILCHTRGSTLPRKPLATLCEDIRREGIQCDENSGTIFPVAAKCATGAGCTAFFTMLCRKRWWESWCRGYL